MTPAEAREIEKQEFEAECAAIRQRAYALLRNGPSRPSFSPAPTQLEQIAIGKEAAGPNAQLYSHAGRTMTLDDWAKHLGIPYQTLAHRLRQRWPIERVLTGQNLRGRCRTIIEHDGRAMTLAEWAKHLGLKHNTLYARLARGVPVSLALSSGRLPRHAPIRRAPRGGRRLSG
ncbi:MAG TPA: hypothetical protein VGO06_06225 [Bosea sp. (in: a-proteobacteria)]|jgi:hypothetical protein|nr:hypothetical protein [Bosea sp. (in: a-proteobacteria)]